MYRIRNSTVLTYVKYTLSAEVSKMVTNYTYEEWFQPRDNKKGDQRKGYSGQS